MGAAEDAAALAQWGKMSYAERLWVLSQNYPGGIPQAELDKLVEDEIKRQYGYLSTYLSHPEVGPILKRAATEGWTQERLQAELFKTNWWKQSSESFRQWELLKASDPKTAEQQRTSMIHQMEQIASQAGINTITPGQFKQLAEFAIAHGLDQANIQRAVVNMAHFDPNAAPPTGAIGMTMTDVKRRADEYGLTIGDEDAFNWAKQAASGMVTADAIDVQFREQAKGRYSWLADDLDRGATIKQLFSPIINNAANLLEISPDQISLADPKFQKFVDFTDGSGVRRSMTGAEAADYVRSLSEWDQTDNAKREYAGLGEQILQTFGKVAS